MATLIISEPRARDFAGNESVYAIGNGDTSYPVQICAVAADSYEPDNDASHARTITTDNLLQTHNFHIAGDQDWLKFSATSGKTYTIQTNNTGNFADTVLSLYGTDGSTLITWNDDYPGLNWGSRIDWQPTQSGTYYLKVNHYDQYAYGCTTQYTISVHDVSPVISSLSPSSTAAGGPSAMLTVNGINFADNSVVRWNGTDLATTFVSNTQLTADIPASDLTAVGSASITVANPTPIPSISNTKTFTVVASNPMPTLTTLSPSSATAGGAAFTLTVNGTNFINDSVVRWNGMARTTIYVSSTKLTASILAGDIASAGTVTVTVFNPAPGGGETSTLNFIINNPVPILISLSPISATAGGPGFTLTVNGTNFVNGSVIRWNAEDLTTTRVSSTQLTANITADEIAMHGNASVTVFNPGPGGGESLSLPFQVKKPTPVLISLSPTEVTMGEAGFTLTATGSNFQADSIIRWNGFDLSTSFISSGQLTAYIDSIHIASCDVVNITVYNPDPSGSESNAMKFIILGDKKIFLPIVIR